MKFIFQLSFAEERHSILSTSSEGFKKEAKALEDKCKSINEAFVKTRVEAEKFKQVLDKKQSIQQ